MLTKDELKAAREAAAKRYAALGHTLLAEVGMSEDNVKPRKSLTGRAWYGMGLIEAPWPTTTRRRLYILAHECGHFHHRHGGKKKLRHVEEYEAETYAHDALRRHGVAVPEKETLGAKRYVARMIVKGLNRGMKIKSIDKTALEYARTAMTKRFYTHLKEEMKK